MPEIRTARDTGVGASTAVVDNAVSQVRQSAPSAAAEAEAPGDRCVWAGAARWWYHQLDGRRVDGRYGSWIAHVVGIHEVRPHLWVQIESGDMTRRLVMHVTLETRLREALAAIADTPGDVSQLAFVDVPQLAGSC